MPPAEKNLKFWDYKTLGVNEKSPHRALVWKLLWEEVVESDSRRSAGQDSQVRTQTNSDETDGGNSTSPPVPMEELASFAC